VTEVQTGVSGGGPWSRRLAEGRALLRVPLSRPEVHRPLLLILAITGVQQASGLTFTKKFLLQVLSPTNDNSDPDNSSYYFAMLIHLLRLIANLLMARLLITCRVRLPYFLSLFATVGCLICLGYLLHPHANTLLSPRAEQCLRVATLSVHVFAVQFGLQTLAGQLTDTILPIQAKPVLKGVIRAAHALMLLLFTTHMKLLPEDSFAFWTMAALLVLASPALYVHVPELRGLGREAGDLYFLPSKTIFYNTSATCHVSELFQAKQAQQRFQENSFQDNHGYQSDELHQKQETGRQRKVCQNGVCEQEDDSNRLAIIFVANIHGRATALCGNPARKLVARGSGTLTGRGCCGRPRCGIFLFTDILIVSRQVKENRVYINEIVIEIGDTFTVSRLNTQLTFADSQQLCEVSVESLWLAERWERSARLCKDWASREGSQMFDQSQINLNVLSEMTHL
jgi:hypothetical protein